MTTDYINSNNIKLVFTPAYSSAMNPVERCWQLLKQGLRVTLADATEITTKTFVAMVEEHLEKLR